MKLERIVIIKDKMAQITSVDKTDTMMSSNAYIVFLILSYLFYKFEVTDNEHAPNISFITTFDYIGDNISGFKISNKKIGDFHYACNDYGFDYFDDSYTDGNAIDKMIEDIQRDFNIKSICRCEWYEQEYLADDKGQMFISANNK